MRDILQRIGSIAASVIVVTSVILAGIGLGSETVRAASVSWSETPPEQIQGSFTISADGSAEGTAKLCVQRKRAGDAFWENVGGTCRKVSGSFSESSNLSPSDLAISGSDEVQIRFRVVGGGLFNTQSTESKRTVFNRAPSTESISPKEKIQIQPGDTLTFEVEATDQDTNLVGVDWYVNGGEPVKNSEVSDGSASATLEETFDSEGTYTIEAQAFDEEGAYDENPSEWKVIVEESVIDRSIDSISYYNSKHQNIARQQLNSTYWSEAQVESVGDAIKSMGPSSKEEAQRSVATDILAEKAGTSSFGSIFTTISVGINVLASLDSGSIASTLTPADSAYEDYAESIEDLRSNGEKLNKTNKKLQTATGDRHQELLDNRTELLNQRLELLETAYANTEKYHSSVRNAYTDESGGDTATRIFDFPWFVDAGVDFTEGMYGANKDSYNMTNIMFNKVEGNLEADYYFTQVAQYPDKDPSNLSRVVTDRSDPIPEPEISAERKSNDPIKPGESATIEVTVENTADTDASMQTINLGFPNATSSDQIEIIDTSIQNPDYQLVSDPGNELGVGYFGGKQPISYPVAEVGNSWKPGQTQTLTVRVTPEEPGEFRYYYKSVARPGGYSSDPAKTQTGSNVVTDGQGERSYVKIIEVTEPPTAEAGDDLNANIGEGVSFDGSGSSDDVGITTYEWDFDGDGNYDVSGASPTTEHTFRSTGTKDVTLRVTDSAGNTDTDTVSVTIEDATGPTADAGGDKTTTVGSSVTLDGSGSSDNVGITTYEWDIDADGEYEESGASLSHTSETVGEKEVTLRVSDADGNTDTDTITITVNDVQKPPTASDVSVSTDEDSPVDGEFAASDPNKDSLTYSITSGPSNGTVDDNDGSFTYTPDSGFSGSDSFTYEVSDGNGGTATATVAVTVEADTSNGESDSSGSDDSDSTDDSDSNDSNDSQESDSSAELDISYDTGEDGEVKMGEEVEFEATLSGLPDGGSVDRYLWDFGDDIDEADASASHAYVRSGAYTVSVTAVTESGTRYNGTTELRVEPMFADVPPLGDGVNTRNNSMYRVDLQKGQSMGLQSYGGDGVRGSDVLLYGPDGDLIQVETVGDNGLFFGTTAEQSGTYYVGINASAEAPLLDPATSVTPVVRDPDQFEPNQNQSTATPLDRNTTATKLTLTESDRVDWYAVTVDGPTEINVSAEVSIYTRYQSGISLQIYDSENASIGTVDNELPDFGSDDPKSYNESAIASGALNQPEQRAGVTDPGTYYIRVKPSSLDGGGLQGLDGLTEYNLSIKTTSLSDIQQPFDGSPASLPGRIQAEHYDEGGEGVAYHDTDPQWDGRPCSDELRGDTRVDIQCTSDNSGEYNIGRFQTDEWLEYTVDAEPDTYDLKLRVATPRDDRQLRISLGGEVLRTVDIPNTGGWDEYQTVTVENVDIDASQTSVLRVEAVSSGIDLNWFEFEE